MRTDMIKDGEYKIMLTLDEGWELEWLADKWVMSMQATLREIITVGLEKEIERIKGKE